MAISYVRLEFVTRSNGKNACAKAAYNSRDKVVFEGTKFSEPKVYNWNSKESPAHHEILLPKHVDPSFLSMDKLWNLAEQVENRHNSQVAMEMVIALPDDKLISVEDRVELTRRFANEVFIKNGLAVQIDIHQPQTKITLSPETGEIENLDHNWHAHLVATTRRFKENGTEFEKNKLRNFMPDVRNGRVCNGQAWSKIWTQMQNEFFQEKGLNLRVDESGIIPQKHIGPIRLRGRSFSLEEENRQLEQINRFESTDPAKILSKIIETRSVFTEQDVDRFLNKHIDLSLIETVRAAFWEQQEIVPLLDKSTASATGKFSTHYVINEENKILRLSDTIHQRKSISIQHMDAENGSWNLNTEQKRAYDQIINGNRLSCIEGHAGTGKSYLLSSLAKTYTTEGYTVRSLGPDNATSSVLREKNLPNCDNIYRFLFGINKKKIALTNKEVWIIDEASKLGNRPLLELLKIAEKHKVQLIFSGCSSQLSSVERGGMFQVLCSRYGSVELVEIQRQRDAEQRAMTKKLALGEMGAALDQLVNLKAIKWCETKKDAIETLVKTWAEDRTNHPYKSCLMLAHSNSEVRILNELARIYRKEKGELASTEYSCKTSSGKIIVSVGDKIEFRRNDKELAITNGMTGTLLSASEERFIVRLHQKEGMRDITFNPEKFNGFQLGYATTYFRSQGQTVDQAYVLHSQQMSKEKFYVGLTRHVHDAKFFVSKETSYCLADLKRQAFRKEEKEQAFSYTTIKQLEGARVISQKNEYISQLKTSSSILSRFKGHTISTWDWIVSRFQYVSDLSPNHEFFSPKLDKTVALGEVNRLSEIQVDFPNHKQDEIVKYFRENNDKTDVNEKTHSRPLNVDLLDHQTKHRLEAYLNSSRESSNLYSIVKAEEENDLTTSPHYKMWQVSCGLRNEQAYYLKKGANQETLRLALGQSAFDIINERAERYEVSIQKQLNQTIDISAELKDQLEPLLYRLFPDGPTGKDSKGLRFGSKGSITVACRGEAKGSFYDFEQGKGGGPLQLIERALDCDRIQAKAWAREFLGSKEVEFIPSSFKINGHSKTKISSWKSLKPNQSYPAPTLENISTTLSQRYTEFARHEYRDEKGELLFYNLRLMDRSDHKKKIFLPLSYGQWEGSKNSTWAIQTYQTEKRSLYNLDQIYSHPKATVLIVEGEKTADAAQQLFHDKNIICITWQGGASSVSKTDWSSLRGRNAVIWPDNDKVGFKAADSLCTELRRIGVESLQIVNQSMLKSFPEKWDLADSPPPGKNLYDMVLMAKNKTLGISQASFSDDPVERIHAQHLLFHVEERLWNQLEEKHSQNTIEISRDIQKELNKLLSAQEFLSKSLRITHHLDHKLADRLSRQLTLFKAKTDAVPSIFKVEEIRSAITQSTHSCDPIATYVSDQLLSESIFCQLDKKKITEKIQLDTKNIYAKINHEIDMRTNLVNQVGREK